MLLFAESHDQNHRLRPPAALPAAPQAALYHLNAKFTRYELAPDPDALTRPNHDSSQGASTVFTGLPRIDLCSDPSALHGSIGSVIGRRRSTRRFADGPITLSELGNLLKYGAGVTHADDSGAVHRAAPSGGAKYPVSLVVCVRAVCGLPPGIYSYDVTAHGLIPLKTGPRAYDLIKASCLYPDTIEHAAVTVLLIGVLRRSTRKYGERGYRLAVQEAGHIAQNLTLVSTCLGLGSIVLAGFDEPDVERILGIDGESETMLSSVVIGHHQTPTVPEA